MEAASTYYFRLDTFRISSPLFIPIVNQKTTSSPVNFAKHSIIGRDGDIIQVMSRDSKEIVWRGLFYEQEDSRTISEFYDKVEELEAYQLSSGNPLLCTDETYTIEGWSNTINAYVTFNLVEVPANKIQFRANIIEDTNP